MKPLSMTQTLRTLAVLLSYPTAEMQRAAGELREALEAEGALLEPELAGLRSLISGLALDDLFELQERYVLLFDRTRSLSLHLFEHVHGESRDRGQAMVDLHQLYAEHGMVLVASELPDYLPVFLEFLSTLPPEHAAELLGQPLNIVRALAERLARRKSPYAAVFLALEQLASVEAGDERAEGGMADEVQPQDVRPEGAGDDPTDFTALDRLWEDRPVGFGPGAACAPAGEGDGVSRIRVLPRGAGQPRFESL